MSYQYQLTYIIPEDPGMSNGKLVWGCKESDTPHENELWLWNDNTSAYDKVTEEEYQERLKNRKRLTVQTDCWVM